MDEGGAKVLALARSGDLAGAIAAGEAILAQRRDAPLMLFVGMLCCRQGDLSRGIGHLRAAMALAPNEPTARIELARALFAAGDYGAAEALSAADATPATPAGREMQRIRGHALQRAERAGEAGVLFEQLTTADPADFESWHGLGVASLAQNDAAGAQAALLRATQLRPTAIAYWIDLARAYAASKDFAEAAAAAERAVGFAPRDAAAHLEFGRALVGLGRGDEALANLAAARDAAPDNAESLREIADLETGAKAFARAEANYRAALAIRPGLEPAWLGLGKVLERLNRTSELLDLVASAQEAGVTADALALLRARGLRSDGRLEEALAAARAAPEAVDAAARAQLIGDIADRLGDTDTAFAAFSQANALLAAAAEGSSEHAEAYRDSFRKLGAMLTPDWVARWAPVAPGRRRAPLFIFGFPRSGTTLIDTMLGGHPGAVVMEEEPAIDRAAELLGPVERLPTLSQAEVDQLRARYFAEVDRILPDAGDRLIVDKHPLGLGNTALLLRLFPDARFVFVERHPCDVVLSCFITSAQMDAKVANFFEFTGTARLYDRVLEFWQRCREVLPLRLHTIRYETLIADPETELRALAAFAGLDWNPQMLANQSNASARAYIGSPSYAQVAEPIYTRAKGRWLRYRRHMQPVLPILAPWAKRMGYEID